MVVRVEAAMRWSAGGARRLASLTRAGVGRIERAFHKLPSPVVYAISVAAEKGVSLLTIPLMAAYLPPSEYGAYDVAVSVVELVNLIMVLAIGATVIRFASTATTDADARRGVAELLGTALAIVAVFGTLFLIYGPSITTGLGVTTDPLAFRLLLAAAVIAPCIELPLVWMRMKDRAHLFFILVMTRTVAQLVAMALALWLGYGAAGVMAVNGLVLLVFAGVLLVIQLRETGISISQQALGRILTYGLPVVGASLAMFALGNANRFFLPGAVSTETIAHFGLASRLAAVVWLMLYPFDLWWAPRRISTLSEPGGLELGARMWGIGIALLTLAAMGLSLAGPVAVHLLLPKSYEPTIQLLPLLILAQFLHHVTALSNVGIYARDNGYGVLAIDVSGAALAIVGYLVLVPQLGTTGAVLAMLIGNALRLGLYLRIGAKLAPIPYPWVAAIACGVVALFLVQLAPQSGHMVARTAYTAVACLMLLATFWATGLVTRPPATVSSNGTGHAT